jgi:hypothetical protein
MPRIRIVFTGMMAAIAVTLAVSGARAQAATSEPSDAPPAALAGLMPPHESGTAHHAKTAHVKKAAAKKLAAKISKKSNTIAAVPSPQPRAAATDALPANPWPDAVPSATVAAAAPPETAPANDEPAPSEVVVGGQTVQIAASDEINAIDLAADNVEKETPTAGPADRADIAPAPQTALASRAMPGDANALGGASWIAQALAALGGAVAAGAVAWFLIGSGPVRMYG